MHGIRPTAHPIARLRLRGGVIRQRLIAAAWPGLAELALEPVLVRPRPAAAAVPRRALGTGRLPASRPR
jgi:hypothetical protein